MTTRLPLVKTDPWLEPYAQVIEERFDAVIDKERVLTQGGSLTDFASGYLFFGLHRTDSGWVLREWAPNATEIYLIGTFSEWKEEYAYQLKQREHGVWELMLPQDALHHLDLYKLSMHWQGGAAERIPAWATRVVQDDETKIFSAQVWASENPYQFHNKHFTPNTSPLLIYECHIGMGQEEAKVGSYAEFGEKILPRIASDGYNCIQIMAIQEHPYYGSFGYHVSSFFAASSRFGTPEELKALIDQAHDLGIAVIMDIVHSHAVKNENEGLGRYDGSLNQFFYDDHRREHPAWDSFCFDYGKDEVLHFLLSNCKYWLEEYRFDGFRFDGVTSMLYYDHGLDKAFGGYGDYYDGGQDPNALVYLTLANKLIHEVNPKAITIAEEMSGMPGLAAKVSDGGMGFDYRMAMGIPDYWIKLIKEKRDEEWSPSSIFWEVTNRRDDERTINYAESHDQALVGDKTIIFRLIDADMYWHMSKDQQNVTVDRGIALHKLIRLITASTINGGYLNFMGNEYGHPEWIDFPRQGNNWSHHHARRQWSLADNRELKYSYLGDFDKAMIALLKSEPKIEQLPVIEVWHNDDDQILAYRRGNLLFAFNFSPFRSFSDYGFLVAAGHYRIVLNSDNPSFGGNGLVDEEMTYVTLLDKLYAKEKKEWLRLYLPARSAIVVRLQ